MDDRGAGGHGEGVSWQPSRPLQSAGAMVHGQLGQGCLGSAGAAGSLTGVLTGMAGLTVAVSGAAAVTGPGS